MIGFLIGKIKDINEDSIILDVNGVGYLVYCNSKILNQLSLEKEISLFIDTQVREDNIQLIGFESKQEQYSFRLLKSVKGVSNKIALNILGSLELNEIQESIIFKRPILFTKVNGIGKKLAERIITELQDKFSGSGIVNTINSTNQIPATNTNMEDAVSALTNFGYARQEAINSVNLILRDKPDMSIEDLIKNSLKLLAG